MRYSQHKCFQPLDRLDEFNADLAPQAVLMMGLPGAGKSTWTSRDGKKWIPGWKSYSVVNPDIQLKKVQHRIAKEHYDLLKDQKDEKSFDQAISSIQYRSGDNVIHELRGLVSYRDFEAGLKFNEFYGSRAKSYYASFMDLRDEAVVATDRIFDDKVVKGAGVLVLDTSGTSLEYMLDWLKRSKENGYTTTVVYLDLPMRWAVLRDRHRRETGGRGVGESVINGYINKMERAVEAYRKDGRDPNGSVDRVLHFKWSGDGENPLRGQWNLIGDDKYFLDRKRKLSKAKQVKKFIDVLA